MVSKGNKGRGCSLACDVADEGQSERRQSSVDFARHCRRRSSGFTDFITRPRRQSELEWCFVCLTISGNEGPYTASMFCLATKREICRSLLSCPNLCFLHRRTHMKRNLKLTSSIDVSFYQLHPSISTSSSRHRKRASLDRELATIPTDDIEEHLGK